MNNLAFLSFLLLLGCQQNSEVQKNDEIDFQPLTKEEMIDNKIYEDDYIILDSLDNWYPVNEDFIMRLKFISFSPASLGMVKK